MKDQYVLTNRSVCKLLCGAENYVTLKRKRAVPFVEYKTNIKLLNPTDRVLAAYDSYNMGFTPNDEDFA